jgi:hypothetical protein
MTNPVPHEPDPAPNYGLHEPEFRPALVTPVTIPAPPRDGSNLGNEPHRE